MTKNIANLIKIVFFKFSLENSGNGHSRPTEEEDDDVWREGYKGENQAI